MRVLINEEYGYRYWEWECPYTRDELIHWWENLGHIGYCPTPQEFLDKGTLKEIGETEFYHAEDLVPWIHLHGDDDSFLSIRPERGYYCYPKCAEQED